MPKDLEVPEFNMNPLDVYIYLPNQKNIYNKCFHKTNVKYNQLLFSENIKLLFLGLQNININCVYYIGDDLFQLCYLNELFQIFKNYKQYYLTNGKNIDEKIELIKKYVFRLDVCRARLNDDDNNNNLNSTHFPTLQQLQKNLYLCHKNNIKTRIVVPMQKQLNYNFDAFVSMAKYLYSDIVFRKLSFNYNDINQADEFFNDSLNICFDVRENYKLIVKQYNGVYVWIESIFSNISPINSDYLVYHPNGLLINQFKNYF